MSDEEVMAIVNKVLTPLGTTLRYYMPPSKVAAIAAMRKVLADERERCAKLADPVEPRGDWAASAYEKQAYDLRLNIADAIRKGGA